MLLLTMMSASGDKGTVSCSSFYLFSVFPPAAGGRHTINVTERKKIEWSICSLTNHLAFEGEFLPLESADIGRTWNRGYFRKDQMRISRTFSHTGYQP